MLRTDSTQTGNCRNPPPLPSPLLIQTNNASRRSAPPPRGGGPHQQQLPGDRATLREGPHRGWPRSPPLRPRRPRCAPASARAVRIGACAGHDAAYSLRGGRDPRRCPPWVHGDRALGPTCGPPALRTCNGHRGRACASSPAALPSRGPGVRARPAPPPAAAPAAAALELRRARAPTE